MVTSNKIISQALAYQKTLFDTSFSAMAAFQDSSCKVMDTAFEKSAFVPDGNKRICTYWMDYIKQTRDNCKEYADNGFDRLKAFFETPDPSGPAAKAAKTAKK